MSAVIHKLHEPGLLTKLCALRSDLEHRMLTYALMDWAMLEARAYDQRRYVGGQEATRIDLLTLQQAFVTFDVAANEDLWLRPR